jgi:hypothetical protein
LLASVILLASLVFPASAQETPEEDATPSEAAPTGEPTPGPDVTTVIRIEVDQREDPIPKNEEFEVRVLVDDVEHLAGFSFEISYDPKRLEPVLEEGEDSETPLPTPVAGEGEGVLRTRALGDFLKSTGREEMFCGAPVVRGNSVAALCTLLGPPLCLDGQPGVSGSGLLGAVYFKSKGGGRTTLSLVNTGLALDDFLACAASVVGVVEAGLPNACLPFYDGPSASAAQLGCHPDGTTAPLVGDPVEAEGLTWVELEGLGWGSVEFLAAEGEVPSIEHRRQDLSIELAKGGGLSMAVLIPSIVVAAVVIAGGGVAAYWWYRRRQAASSQ